jgi:predicted amidohydrolase YtcJ
MFDPTLILHNGRIYTVNPDQPWATAVAIREAHIVAVGADSEILPLAGPQTRLLDLDGRLLLPGLCDAHIHFYDWSLSRRLVDLTGCADKAEMVQRIADRAGQTPAGQWIVGRSWNEVGWRERRLPTRHDLDPVTGDRPAIFWRSDMHSAVANSAALQLAGLADDSLDPEGGKLGRDGDGRLNGLLYELAINPIRRLIPDPTEAELDEALQAATAVLHQWGVTAVHDQRMKDHQDGPIALAAYQRLRRRGQLRQRVNCNIAAHDLPHLAALRLQTGLGDDYLRLGHIKLFADGAMGSRTAWMLEPFVKQDAGEPDNHGMSVTPVAQMAAEIRQAVELGFPASIHAIGDRAIRELLDIFEELAQTTPQPPVPHRIEHVQIIHPDDIPRLARLNLTASVQPIHATDDIDTADLVLGERASRAYNFRSLMTTGALVALGSDAPVANANPFLGFHAAICRQRPERRHLPPWYPDERLTLAQTIFGYTLGAARAAGWQEVIGSIAPGKRADLILLDRDLFALVEQGVQGTEIADTQVLLTLFDGQIVFQR